MAIVVRTWTEDAFDHEGGNDRCGARRLCPVPAAAPPAADPGREGDAARGRSRSTPADEYNTPGRARRAPRTPPTARSACVDPAATRARSALPDDDLRDRCRRRRSSELSASPVLLGGERFDAEWLVGTVEELAEQLEQLASVGISRVMLQHLDHADLDAVAAMGALARATLALNSARSRVGCRAWRRSRNSPVRKRSRGTSPICTRPRRPGSKRMPRAPPGTRSFGSATTARSNLWTPLSWPRRPPSSNGSSRPSTGRSPIAHLRFSTTWPTRPGVPCSASSRSKVRAIETDPALLRSRVGGRR